MSVLILGSALAGCLTACALPVLERTEAPEGEAGAARPEPRIAGEIEGEPLYVVLSKDAIPAIDEPRFVPAREAASFMRPDEPVLGVVGARGTARAYSAWHLDRHEIVNDRLDGEPIAVTW